MSSSVFFIYCLQNRLLTAIKSKESSLSQEEKSRNKHGPHLLYEYTPDVGDSYTSSLPGVFPDIVLNHAK